MLIRLNGEGGVACEHGILKAGSAQTLLDAQQARAEVARQCEQMLAQAKAQAGEIVAAAREQAQALAQQAQQQAAQVVEEARQSIAQAEQEARATGAQQGAMEWHQRHAEQALRAAEASSAMEVRLAAIVTTAVEAVIVAKPRSALYARALRHVQSLTRGATTLTLRVNPEDQDDARAGLGAVRDNTVLPCEIVPDPALVRGSCIFESELGVLDASLGVQIAALRASLQRAFGQAEKEPEEPLPPREDDGLQDLFFNGAAAGDDEDDEDDDDEDEDDEDDDDDEEADYQDDDLEDEDEAGDETLEEDDQ